MNRTSQSIPTAGHPQGEMVLSNASFGWPGTSHLVLRNLSLSFPRGLTLVIGLVGSGKSALLQALLGEMDLENGEINRPNTPVALLYTDLHGFKA